MARKSTKKSKETEEKEEVEETTKKTAKKTTKKAAKKTKKNDNVQLTFRPLFSATRSYTAYLQHKVKRVVNGNEMLVAEPMIEGLPAVLTVRAGEVITVTQDQYEQLCELNFVESEEQVAERKRIERSIEPQHPQVLGYDVMKTNRDFNVKHRDLVKIYTDKLIVVE